MGQASRAGTPLLLFATLLLVACGARGGADETASDAAASAVVTNERVSAELPRGWSRVAMPTIDTRPETLLLTVASSPVTADQQPDICHTPDHLINQLPSGGALVQVSAGAPQRLPGRPPNVKLDRSSYGSYECTGRSHQLAFHQNGRGIHVTAWFDPDRVDPSVRRQAVAFVDSIDVKGFPSRECRASDLSLIHI